MKYRKFDKIEMPASIFGLGCMRFNGKASGDVHIEAENVTIGKDAVIDGALYLS